MVIGPVVVMVIPGTLIPLGGVMAVAAPAVGHGGAAEKGRQNQENDCQFKRFNQHGFSFLLS